MAYRDASVNIFLRVEDQFKSSIRLVSTVDIFYSLGQVLVALVGQISDKRLVFIAHLEGSREL